jgi:hypothetical protein
MPKQVRIRRGTTAQHATFVGADGEVTFDTTKKVLVLHDGVSPGGKSLDGFVVLSPGNPLAVQSINSSVAITGGDDDTTAFAVSKLAEFNNVIINALASIRRLHLQQEELPYGTNVNVNFFSFTSKRLALAGDVTFSGSGMGYGYFAMLRIQCDGTPRLLNFPAGWKFVGDAAPANIGAGKAALLKLWCFGPAETDVIAEYAVQP